MSPRVSIKRPLGRLWLIVEWKAVEEHGEVYAMVPSDRLAMDHRLDELYTGKVVDVLSTDGGAPRKASIVIVSADESFLETEFQHLKEATEQIGLKDTQPPTHQAKSIYTASSSSNSENGDFASSESEWKPDENDSILDKLKAKQTTYKRVSTLKKDTSSAYESAPPKQRISDMLYKKLSTMDRDIFTTSTSEDGLGLDNKENGDTFNDVDILESSMRLQRRFKDLTETAAATLKDDTRPEYPPMTFDQQTQTESVKYSEITFNAMLTNQKLLKAEMVYLYRVVDGVKKHMEAMDRTVGLLQSLNNSYAQMTANENESGHHNGNCGNSDNLKVFDFDATAPENNSVLCVNNYSHRYNRTKHIERKFKDETKHSINGSEIDGADMIPIGSGQTLIPRHIFNQIKWNSYTSATRKLLMSVFPRRTLATHSLTGKSSPAFSNKPAKMQLDAKKISDIVMTVSQMSNVQENLIRNTITTKCSDENKMYRMRQKKMKNKPRIIDANQENESPQNMADE